MEPGTDLDYLVSCGARFIEAILIYVIILLILVGYSIIKHYVDRRQSNE